MLQKIQNVLYILFLTIFIWQLLFSENSLMGKQEAMFEIDGNKYVISNMGGTNKVDPVPIKNVGTRLSCDALNDITGQKILNNKEIENTTSFISGNKLNVDCIEPYSGIALDYLPEDFYKYDGSPPNNDVYEFYDRLALNTYKKEKLNEVGINYIPIPYTVDHCQDVDGKLQCDKNTNIKLRKQRLMKYIDTKIHDIL